MKHIFCALMTVLLLFSACDSSEPEGFRKQEKKYHTFDPAVTWELLPLVSESGEPVKDRDTTYRPLDYSVMEDGIVWLCDRSETDENGYVKAVHIYTETFDFDGNSLGVTEHPLDRKYRIPSLYAAWEILPDGEYLLAEAYSVGFNKQEMRMIRYDSAGTVLAECRLPLGIMPALAVSESCYAVSLANQILLFDTDLQRTAVMAYPGEMNELFFGEDGTLYGQDWQGRIVRVDFESRKVTEVLPDERNTGFAQMFGGGETFLYSADQTGVVGYAEGAEEGSITLDWDSSCLLFENTEILQVINEDLFLVISADNLEMEKRYALLRRMEGDEEIRREHITVLLPDRGKRINAAELAAVQFNRTNEQYYVTLETAEDDYDKEIFARMENGDAPDMVLFDTRLEKVYLNLEKQGYLTDLSVYGFADTLTGSAAGAVMRGDAMYRVPYTVQYDTLVRTGLEDTVTAEELVSRTGKGEMLFTDPYMLPNHFLTCIQSLFIDPAAGTCHLDSEEFAEYLTFYSRLSGCTNEEAGMLSVSNFDGRLSSYTLSDAALPGKLQKGEIPFFLLTVGTMDAFAYTELLYGGTVHSICGFPGVPLLVSHMDSGAILETSGSAEGAAAFLSYLLSDEVQTSSLILNSYVPVTADAVEAELAYNYRYCGVNSMDILETAWKTMEPEVLDIFEQKWYREIRVTEQSRNRIRALLDDDRAGRYADPTLEGILLEEISAYLSGDRTMEDTVRVLQSRVSTYLAE